MLILYDVATETNIVV